MDVIGHHLYFHFTLHYCEGCVLNRNNNFSIDVLFDLNIDTTIRELKCIFSHEGTL